MRVPARVWRWRRGDPPPRPRRGAGRTQAVDVRAVGAVERRPHLQGEIGGAAVLAWGIVNVAIQRRRRGSESAAAAAGATLVAAIAGNIFVALAWFGPAIWGAGLHTYGLPTRAAQILIGWTVSNTLVLAIAASGIRRVAETAA